LFERLLSRPALSFGKEQDSLEEALKFAEESSFEKKSGEFER
jgi:hypothetical protein